MKINRFILAVSAAGLFLGAAGIAKADLIPGGVVDISGTGSEL
jgi:hypothetical protein